jgi:hypothetical protein
MGYYLAIGRTPGMPGITKQELWDFIAAKPWSEIDDTHPYSDPYFSVVWGENWQYSGCLDVIDTLTKDDDLQAPWLNLRLSWSTGKKFPEALRFVLKLAGELQMLVKSGDRLVTHDILDQVCAELCEESGAIKQIFG